MKVNAVGKITEEDLAPPQDQYEKLAPGTWACVLTRWEQIQSKKGAYYWVVTFEACDDPTQKGPTASFWILLDAQGQPARRVFNGMNFYMDLLAVLDKNPENEFNTEDQFGSCVRVTVEKAGLVAKMEKATDDEEAVAVDYWVQFHPNS